MNGGTDKRTRREDADDELESSPVTEDAITRWTEQHPETWERPLEGLDAPGLDLWLIGHAPLLRDAYVAYVVRRAMAEAGPDSGSWALMERLIAARIGICGVVSNSGPNGEPLACAYPAVESGQPMHEHSWATLPTFSPEPSPVTEPTQSVWRPAPEGCASLELDGKVVVIQSDTDPGDMGEPREWDADGVHYLVVPSMSLWPTEDES